MSEKTKTRKQMTDEERIKLGQTRLTAFRSAKAAINAQVKDNETWFRSRHCTTMYEAVPKAPGDPLDTNNRKAGDVEIKPASPWLLNAIKNKHADGMDNLPRANFIAREAGDEEEAYVLGKIMPPLLTRVGFERIYSNVQWTKPIQGWAVYAVTWDADAEGGMGEISIKDANILNLYWDQEATHIQDSSDVFYVHKTDQETLRREYPDVDFSKLAAKGGEQVDTYADNPQNTESEDLTIVDWYYKARNSAGKRVVHLCQYVQSVMLSCTETNETTAESGLYDHGMYPFVFDVLYPLAGQLAGFGELATGKNKQAYIDKLEAIVLQNALWCTKPRYLVSRSAGVNPNDFADQSRMIVEYDGNLQNKPEPIEVPTLNGNVLSLLSVMTEELKETTGARDVAMGGTTGGVTAASAIATMQEASGKLSRDSNRGSHRAFREVVEMVVELIRQFYTEEHKFRVMGDGQTAYVSYSNKFLNARRVVDAEGRVTAGEPHRAHFDIEVTSEKSTSYSRMQQNQLTLELYGAGFFDPNNAPAALAALQVMDFDGQEDMLRMIGENDTRAEKIAALGEYATTLGSAIDQINAQRGIRSNYAQQTQAMVQGLLGGGGSGAVAEMPAQLPGGPAGIVAKAREEAAGVSTPT